MSGSVRVLGPDDRAGAQAFLDARGGANMHMASNLFRYGTADEGGLYQGLWLGAYDGGGALRGVLQRVNQGSLLLSAPDPGARAALAEEAARRGFRPARLLGMREEVEDFHAALHAATPLPVREARPALLMELRAEELPELSMDGFRAASPEDVDWLTGWKRDFRIHAMGDRPEWVDMEVLRGAVRLGIEEGRQFLLEEAGQPVCIGALSAVTSTVVQLGGVYTPPERRGRRYGSRMVAALCRDQLDAEGKERVVLSVDPESEVARRIYTRLGFHEAGMFLYLLAGEP